MSQIATLAIKNYLSVYSGLSKPCWRGIIYSFIESMLIGVYYFLPLYFVHRLNLSIETSSAIISFYGMGTILGGYIGGKLSDKIQPSIISIFSLFIQACTFFILIRIESTYLLMIDMFIVGIASYGFITSNHTWVLQQCNDIEAEKLKAINILSTASNLGLGISALILGLFSIYKFEYILILSAILLFISAICLLSTEWEDISNPVITVLKQENIHSQEIGHNAKNINKSIITVMLICLFMIGMIIAQLGATYPLFFENIFSESGMDIVGKLFALNSFLVVILETPLVTYFNDKNKIVMTGIGASMIGGGMFILCFTNSFMLAIISCVIYTLGEMIFFSITQLVCYQQYDANNKGHSLGLYRTVYASSRVAGPLAGGLVFQHYGSETLWCLCGLIGLIALSLCLYYKNTD